MVVSIPRLIKMMLLSLCEKEKLENMLIENASRHALDVFHFVRPPVAHGTF